MTPSAPASALATHRDVAALVRYIGKPDQRVAMDLLRRSRQDRLVRAAQGWGICWGAAIVAVFMPLLHFILVPSLLLAGPVVASFRWRETATVLGVRGTCPGCGAAFDASLKMPAKPEIPWRCPACGRPLTFVIDAAQLADESGAGAPATKAS